MTTLGMKCLLEDLMDKQPETTDKKIISLEMITYKKQKYLVITYEDCTTSIKLYET